MATNQISRLKPSILQTDKDSYAALETIEGYNPANFQYAIAALIAANEDLNAAEQLEAQANVAATTARINAMTKEWEFHKLILGAKDQVLAQFGRDSDEVKAVGLKKKSEYKPRGRKVSTGGASQQEAHVDPSR
jgi:hypothetical protein